MSLRTNHGTGEVYRSCGKGYVCVVVGLEVRLFRNNDLVVESRKLLIGVVERVFRVTKS